MLAGDEGRMEMYSHHVGSRFVHPFALLHKAMQHDKMANAVASPFIVSTSIDPSLVPYVPNKNFEDKKTITSGSGLIQTVVYVAERDLVDEAVVVGRFFE